MVMNRSEKFFNMLKWAVERKDFEDFWPVGLESTGPRYWPQLVLDLDETYQDSGKFAPPDYPTANVALAFCLIYGMRELAWPPTRCSALLEAIFDAAQSSKSGDIFNSNGANLLWDFSRLMQEYNSGVDLLKREVSHQDIYELSGQVLALAEAEYFMNHRIATEKHGPYISEDGDIFVVRSFKNLWPIDLWPELRSINLDNNEVHFIFRYHTGAVQFDVLSNLLTPLPPKESLVSIVVVAADCNAWNVVKIRELSGNVQSAIYLIGNSLLKMDKCQKSERMTEILYYGCRHSLKSWRELAQNAINLGRTRAIQHPVPTFGDERLSYYDLTK